MVAAAKSEMHFAFGPRSGHKGGWHGSRNALSAHCRTHKKDYCRNSILMRSKEGDDYDYDYDDDDDNGNGDEDTRTHPNWAGKIMQGRETLGGLWLWNCT